MRALGGVAPGGLRREDRGGGHGFMIAGTVASILAIGVTAMGCGAVPGEPSTPSGSEAAGASQGAGSEPDDQDINKIRPGQCFNDTANGNGSTTGPGEEVEELAVVSCSTPHDAQALAVFQFKRGPWPGEQQIDKAAETGCEKRIGKRIARDPSADKLTFSWYAPTQEGWGLTGGGDRGVLCAVVHATDGKRLTRPVR